MSAAAAAASKCATLRQGGRYGGSLGGVAKAAGSSPCPNFKTAQPPTVATVSKDYTNSYTSSTLSYNTATGAPKKSNIASGASSERERKEEAKQQAVYSIDASYRQHQSGKSQDSTVTKGISILNQPLPEIPHSAMKMTEQAAPKNIQQPLCAANLNQYRSLQRPGMQQKSSFANQPPPQQTIPLKSSMKQPQTPAPPPKVVPPQLPPKNRHKDLEGKSHQKQSMQSSKGQSFNTLQYPSSKHHQPSTHTTFGYDNKSRDYGGGGGYQQHGYQQSGAPQAGTYDKKYSMGQQYETSRMTSFHGGDASSYGYPVKVSKSHQQQGYQTMPHQPKHQQYQQSASKSHSHHQSSQQQQQQHQSSKQSSSRRDDPPVYYRSLQRGGANTAGGAHNDLYSVTEL